MQEFPSRTPPSPSLLLPLLQDDWLEVAPRVLPLWAATPLAPLAGPKPLLHYLVCPEQQLPQAQQLIKVGGVVDGSQGAGARWAGA
jgi:hypothetical protein